MTVPDDAPVDRVPLSRSQQNLYNGVIHDNDPGLYLIRKRYRFHPLELPKFLTALETTILENPVQLCVLEAPPPGVDYPDLVARLQPSDIVHVGPDNQGQSDHCVDELMRLWSSGIFTKPLVAYAVRTDRAGCVSRLDVCTHHILIDGGGTGIIEADLARNLTIGGSAETPCVARGLAKIKDANLCETTRVEESLQRLSEVVQRELTDEARHGGHGLVSDNTIGSAAKGVLCESVQLSGVAYDAILALSDTKQIPLNVLVAAAAVAVDASLRQCTESLLVHAVDNRFGDPDLNVATCLVNSVAHSTRFPPFASVEDVVRTLDRGYVKAVRRRWFREEHYRRMYLAINHTAHVDALTLNFIRESCARTLRPFLAEAPIATDIGPVEGMTVASVLDEDERTLNLAIWNRADLSPQRTHPGVAKRIAAALESMPTLWDQPIAIAVDEWFGIGADGARRSGSGAIEARKAARAWFLPSAGGVQRFLDGRRYVYPWVAWLVRHGSAPGDVLVFADDDTDKTIDLLVACHLAGCGYSSCDLAEDVPLRASAIAEHGGGISAHVVDVGAVRLAPVDDELRTIVDARMEQVARDEGLSTKTAYIMPTSGSTGQPKLVHISHGSLALFCDAATRTYGWGPDDTILQCAPLTSDISVEEIFGAATAGAELIRSPAMRAGDFAALTSDLLTTEATLIDLPTAIWHLLCEDDDALDAMRRSRLRQIVIGGEAIRSAAVDKWVDSDDLQRISVMSTYGPTESTVVVAYLPLVGDGTAAAPADRLRLGRPIAPGTVFIAFGELVIVGDLVSAGYLGIDGPGFGAVTTSDGSRQRAFATADRVTIDDDGFPVFAGRRDAVVKISGKRIDTAVVTKRVLEDPAVADVAVELHSGRLGVWFESHRAREAKEDAATATRIRLILVSLGVASFFVLAVPSIPRKINGKVDSDSLRAMPQVVAALPGDAETGQRAADLAELWSVHLGRVVAPSTSLLSEGIGSLDLIRILPDTRSYLNRQISVLDLISADNAVNLVTDFGDTVPTTDSWMDATTAAEIERDLAELCGQRQPAPASDAPCPNQHDERAIVVLGASGILGTGFARAVLDRRLSGVALPEVVLATRSPLPDHDPWTTLRNVDRVRIDLLPAEFDTATLEALIRGTDAGTVINCVGNTNVLVPYRELRPANVEIVCALAEVCARHGTRLVHLSTFVVNGQAAGPEVADPRQAPYPYAASKSVAELALAASSRELNFTIVRLPRVLGDGHQLQDSADVLISVVDGCTALRAYPSVALTEEVTTAQAVGSALLGMLTERGGSASLGRGITVTRGEAISYADFLGEYGFDELDPIEWKHRLDQSAWAKRNLRRWSVVDGWFTLGMRLGARSYAEYLADRATIALGVDSVTELDALPLSVHALLSAPVVQGDNDSGGGRLRWTTTPKPGSA
ncbi:MAG: AMP-binding protein [Actinomycetota bacterium]|uniref:AMP-binding protein n=1 Tax=Mycobacterium lentiflavum TaxID=141349 RepID=A0ABY3UMI6_MYCLN|nr:AMP-binding protein [Mycobacterium lentiflavum]MEE3062909.1 AMP-binding protein [Actinomycetota bacterium]ULP40822.1 AMP-binding protein [Mycobacterium lentiflavum]